MNSSASSRTDDAKADDASKKKDKMKEKEKHAAVIKHELDQEKLR